MKIETVDIQNLSGIQSITLPHEIRIDDDRVYVKKMGNVVYIIQYHTPWQSFYDSLSGFSSDFMDNRNEPPLQNRELFD